MNTNSVRNPLHQMTGKQFTLMMLKTVAVTIVICAVALFALGGCASTPTDPSQPQAESQNLDEASTALRIASRGAATYAITKDAKNEQHVRLAVTVLDEFLVGNAYTPGALSDALKPHFKELRDPGIKLAIDTALDFYQIFYGRTVRGKVGEQAAARLLITALRDGARDALGQ